MVAYMYLFLLIEGLFGAFVGMAYGARAPEDLFSSLKDKLLSDGFPKQQLAVLYPPGTAPLYKTVSETLRIQESKLNYDQFLQPKPMEEARSFLESHKNLLLQAEQEYGVSRCVIVAILLIETRFGTYTGKTPTLAVLSTFALMDSPAQRDRVWRLLPEEDRLRWGRAAFDQKLSDRAKWAYEELSALLKLANGSTRKIKAYKGSVMGAVGWAQFLPSSLVRWGVDGDRDGEVDLFQVKDAVFSVANYLRAHGWCSAKSRSEQEQVIYTYNKSRPYVATVLSVAENLGECPGAVVVSGASSTIGLRTVQEAASKAVSLLMQ